MLSSLGTEMDFFATVRVTETVRVAPSPVVTTIVPSYSPAFRPLVGVTLNVTFSFLVTVKYVLLVVAVKSGLATVSDASTVTVPAVGVLSP